MLENIIGCSRSLVHFYSVSFHINIDKTSWRQREAKKERKGKIDREREEGKESQVKGDREREAMRKTKRENHRQKMERKRR